MVPGTVKCSHNKHQRQDGVVNYTTPYSDIKSWVFVSWEGYVALHICCTYKWPSLVWRQNLLVITELRWPSHYTMTFEVWIEACVNKWFSILCDDVHMMIYIVDVIPFATAAPGKNLVFRYRNVNLITVVNIKVLQLHYIQHVWLLQNKKSKVYNLTHPKWF